MAWGQQTYTRGHFSVSHIYDVKAGWLLSLLSSRKEKREKRAFLPGFLLPTAMYVCTPARRLRRISDISDDTWGRNRVKTVGGTHSLSTSTSNAQASLFSFPPSFSLTKVWRMVIRSQLYFVSLCPFSPTRGVYENCRAYFSYPPRTNTARPESTYNTAVTFALSFSWREVKGVAWLV